jgi:hypothetical protein
VKACKLGRNLRSQAVLIGSVTEYGYFSQGSDFAEPRLGFEVTLFDNVNCRPLWKSMTAKTSSGITESSKGSLSGLAMASVNRIVEKLTEEIGDRVLDFSFRCGPRKLDDDKRCVRGPEGSIDFDKCPEAIPYFRLGREPVSLEGDEIIFNKWI